MSLQRETRLCGRHPDAVVGDRHEGVAALAQLDPDAPRIGVEGVLDEFLHDGGRALDDLPGRDLIDQIVGQEANPSVFIPLVFYGCI